jgi:hypothetical protein
MSAVLQLVPFQFDLFQHYWRCAHHLCAIENFFANVTTCQFGCHTSTLRWHDNGTNRSTWSERS